MILTDKAELNFNLWLIEYYLKNRQDYNRFSNEIILRKHYRKTEVEKNALIIEWLDSANIFIQIDFENREPIFSYYVYSGKDICSGEYNANSRSEATQQAILKANSLYNDMNK